MSRILNECENIWGVYVPDEEYNPRLLCYMSDYAEARKLLNDLGGQNKEGYKIVQQTLWERDGIYYEVTMKVVMIDQQKHKKSGLAKLTYDEKRALGLL